MNDDVVVLCFDPGMMRNRGTVRDGGTVYDGQGKDSMLIVTHKVK